MWIERKLNYKNNKNEKPELFPLFPTFFCCFNSVNNIKKKTFKCVHKKKNFILYI